MDTADRKSTQVENESTTQIRVQIAQSASEITIAASTNAVIRDLTHRVIAKLQANQLYSVLADSHAGKLKIGAEVLPNALWIDAEAGAVMVDGHWYEGRLQIVNIGGELLAINQVDIERYLCSVVGSEMYADWQPQALMAQAVAARSYAVKFLENPVSDRFDMGSDEAFQAYKGLESVTHSTVQAVEETRGQVLVQGNRILFAEYAASDALTRSAHRGQGMSQSGAQARAELGWSYLEILGDYYHKAGIALLSE
ncbi:MAG TPA: SpoIID/LytB domain-containing protein [Leptolyngbya sp.]|nr:SpoIID/LytB domain-containing protein [Leptolyngbya sp.]